MQDIHDTSAIPRLSAYRWFPEAEPRAIVVISHGLAEHASRYAEFGRKLAARGFLAYAHDHPGHGKSAEAPEDLGFFEERGGWKLVRDCLEKETLALQREYPRVPIFLFGHSMGSFVARDLLSRTNIGFHGAILSGTAGHPGLAGRMGAWIAAIEARWRGPRHRSRLMDSLIFGSYNKRIPQARTSFDWLSRDQEEVDAYIADPFCGFRLSSRMFADFLTGLLSVSSYRSIRKLPNDLPILLISGTEDPVGAYGKGPQWYFQRLRRAGKPGSELRLYPDCRHEIFHELNRHEIMDEVVDWIADSIS